MNTIRVSNSLGPNYLQGLSADGTSRQRVMKCVEVEHDFVCFVALRPKTTVMVMTGRSVHLTTLFPGQA